MGYTRLAYSIIRTAFYSAYIALSFIIIIFLAANLQSGVSGVYLFIWNDVVTHPNRLAFNSGFLIAFLLSAIACLHIIKIPLYDFFNRILTINIVVYGILGLTLSVSRIQLFSRPVFFSEFLLTTILLIVFHLIRHRVFPTRLIGFPGVDSARFNIYPSLRVTPLKNETLNIETIDGVIVDFRKTLDVESSRLLTNIGQRRFPVYDSTELLENMCGRVTLEGISTTDLESIKPPRLYPLVKKNVELLFVLAASPVLLLVILIAIIISRAESPGPFFFTQIRVGRQGSPFKIFKLRTMQPISKESTETGAASRNLRVTRVGRLLRRLRIDELPQIWHVITGDMSLIGPRPEQDELATEFQRTIPYYGLRHSVRPGISGWAQVMHGYAYTMEETKLKLEFDLFYIKNMSLWLDLVIVLKTLRTIFFGSGSK
jgi:lipopolysaccharide/colanic/teichoic acid biosynthesis glycosyltransferase